MRKVLANPAELLLVGNPAPRRKSTKRPSAAQMANRARFAAMARARANPAPRHHKRRKSSAPRKRHYRRNPIGGNAMRGLMPMLKGAAYGGVGAIASDVGYGFLMPYLPAIVQTPLSATGGINPAYYLGKGAFTIALGVLAKNVLGAKAGPMTEGALAVVFHDAMKQFVQGSGMAIQLGAGPGFMPGGQQLPQLPIARNLRQYVGSNRVPTAQTNLRQYVSLQDRESQRR